jgi:hypothetical protein
MKIMPRTPSSPRVETTDEASKRLVIKSTAVRIRYVP